MGIANVINEIAGENIEEAYKAARYDAQRAHRSSHARKASGTIAESLGMIPITTRKAGITYAEAKFLKLQVKRNARTNITKNLNEGTLSNKVEVHEIILGEEESAKQALREFYQKNKNTLAIVCYSEELVGENRTVLIETQGIRISTKAHANKWWAIGNYPG